MLSASIQEKIDDYKEQLPDQLYRELCALTMNENRKEKEQEQKEQDFYEVKYVIASHTIGNRGGIVCRVDVKTKIVKLEKKYFVEVCRQINSFGYSFNKLFIMGGPYLEIIKHKHKELYNQLAETDEYDEDEDTGFVSIQITPKILSIKKAK